MKNSKGMPILNFKLFECNNKISLIIIKIETFE